MAFTTRESSFSYDPRSHRSPRREHWIPLEPGKSDLKPRCHPPVTGLPGDEQTRREPEEVAY